MRKLFSDMNILTLVQYDYLTSFVVEFIRDRVFPPPVRGPVDLVALRAFADNLRGETKMTLRRGFPAERTHIVTKPTSNRLGNRMSQWSANGPTS